MKTSWGGAELLTNFNQIVSVELISSFHMSIRSLQRTNLTEQEILIFEQRIDSDSLPTACRG